MKLRHNIFLVLFMMLLFTALNLHAEIDHIHFGSKINTLEGVTVSWRGNYSHCRIKWGYTPSYEKYTQDIEGRIEFGDSNYYLFNYTFPEKLTASQTIHYAFQEFNGPYDCCQCTLNWTDDYTFQTSSDIASQHFMFIAGGDSRGEMCSSNMDGWKAVADKLKTTNAEFYLNMGDLYIQGGDKKKMEAWYNAGSGFLTEKMVFYGVGNHERYGDPFLTTFLTQFVLPENGNYSGLYYSFEFGNAVFIILSTEYYLNTPKGKALMDQQTNWLTEQLKKYRGKGTKTYKEWVFIGFHKPFFTIDGHMGEMTSAKTKDVTGGDFSQIWWKNIFDEYGVDVVLNGHTHLYMRSVPLLLKGTAPGGKDIMFDEKGLPTSKPDKPIVYGNQKNQGRLEIISGGFGVKLLTDKKIPFKDQWYVEKYSLDFHYCQFEVDGKTLNMTVKRISDDQVIDQLTIKHQ